MYYGLWTNFNINNMDIVKKIYVVARDKDGNEYPLKNWNGEQYCDEVIHENIKGELVTETEQDKYDDGTYARSYTETTYFYVGGKENETKKRIRK